jgi:deoxyadenosine/deoxycytidine kinase
MEQQPLLVGISGSHGSGKTTLCHQVVAELKRRSIRCALVTNTARRSLFLASGIKSPEMHLEIMAMHVAEETQACRDNDVVICDRTVFDFLVYGKLRFEGEDHLTLKAMEAFIGVYKSIYACVFRTTQSYGNLDKDMLRGGEEIDPTVFDNALLKMLTLHGMPHQALSFPATSDIVTDFVHLRMQNR